MGDTCWVSGLQVQHVIFMRRVCEIVVRGILLYLLCILTRSLKTKFD